MPPLYPALKERPAEFRMNYESPLHDGLVFAGMGGSGCVGANVLPDSSPYHNNGIFVNAVPETDWTWIPTLRRFGIRGDGSRRNYTQHRKPCALNGTMTIAVWYYPNTSYCSGIFWVDPYGDFLFKGRYGSSDSFQQSDGAGGTAVLNFAPVSSGWSHNVFIRNAPAMTVTRYLNGANKQTHSYSAAPTSGGAYINVGCHPGFGVLNSVIADALAWTRMLSEAEIAALADPSNVDLRVGGVPLILPPRRRFWPVVSEQAVPKMVPWHLFQHVGV